MKYMLILSCLLFFCSCQKKVTDKDMNTLIIFHDGSISCKQKIIDFAKSHDIHVVYNMKNINSIVLSGVRKPVYLLIKAKLGLIKCVYGVNDNQITHLNN